MEVFLNEVEARELLARARREPLAVFDSGDELLRRAGDDARIRAIVLRALTVAGLIAEGAVMSAEFGERSLAAARDSGDSDLVVESILSLSSALAFGGDNGRAFELLGEARGMSSGNLNAEVIFQIGTLKARAGFSDEARALYSEALPVFVEFDDDESIAMTLHNRGMINLYAGDLDQALDDFLRAREIETRLGMGPAVAAVDHNIGLATALKGDLPTALEMLDRSEAKHLEFAESPAEVQVSRVEVLLSAGLFREAERLAEQLVQELGKAGLEEDRAEAVLAWAMAARLAGASSKADQLAAEAGRMFLDQGREAWVRNAEQVGLGARLDSSEVTATDVAKARSIAEELAEADQAEAAFSARLTAGLIALTCGDKDSAVSELRAIAAEDGGTVQRRLSSALAGSLVLEMEGDPVGAASRARRGMELLDEYQAVLGASDVRAGVEKHAARLGELGLRLAAASGDPLELLDWMEQTRSRSMQLRPVRTDQTAPFAEDLTSLRQVQAALRTAEGREAIELGRRRAALETSIRDKSRYRDRTARSSLVATADEIVSSLSDTTLVEFAAIEGRLWRVTATSERVEAHGLGDASEVVAEVGWHRFALRRLALGRGDVGQAEEMAGRIDRMLFSDVDIDRRRTVIVPTPAMYAFAWSSLPSLDDRELIVAPAAALWHSRTETPSSTGPAAVIAGPDLLHAIEEADAVAGVYGMKRAGAGVTPVAEAMSAMEGSAVAHAVCHGSFVLDNPLFSSLRLGDGDMHVYDIEQLTRPPGLMVLSACDSGFSASYPGEELLGLTSAVLAMGTRTVVASVGLVPDTEETMAVMVALHQRLVDGDSAADALARATAVVGDDSPTGYVARRSFLCIGAG